MSYQFINIACTKGKLSYVKDSPLLGHFILIPFLPDISIFSVFLPSTRCLRCITNKYVASILSYFRAALARLFHLLVQKVLLHQSPSNNIDCRDRTYHQHDCCCDETEQVRFNLSYSLNTMSFNWR